MLVPKKDRLEIYRLLFKDGVLVAREEPQLPSHPDLPGVKNLYVIQLMRGFVSKGFVRANYAWRHHYWFLTNEGIEYLRDYLHLPPTVVPATLRQSQKTLRPPRRREFSQRPPRSYPRDEYRGDKGAEGGEGREGRRFPPSEGGEGGFRGRGRGRGRGFAAGGRGGPRRPPRESTQETE